MEDTNLNFKSCAKLRKIAQIVFDQKKFFKEYHFGKPQFFFSSL